MHFLPVIPRRAPEGEDQRQVAMGYVADAFAEARLDGLEVESIAHAAIFAAFVELVATYGESAAAGFAERLSPRIQAGEFTVDRSSH